jgi:hypothetical protein
MYNKFTALRRRRRHKPVVTAARRRRGACSAELDEDGAMVRRRWQWHRSLWRLASWRGGGGHTVRRRRHDYRYSQRHATGAER